MPNTKAYRELLSLLHQRRSTKEWDHLLHDLLTPQERASLAERWQITQLLHSGMPQRDISKKLGVSISKITRGSRALKESRGGFTKALKMKK